jgi:hypothetical protein
MIKPVAKKTDPKFKKATMLFFPCRIETLISNAQQRRYNLSQNGFEPQHITCIIGINASLVLSIAMKAREHPLFIPLRTFTYLTPSNLSIEEERYV